MQTRAVLCGEQNVTLGPRLLSGGRHRLLIGHQPAHLRLSHYENGFLQWRPTQAVVSCISEIKSTETVGYLRESTLRVVSGFSVHAWEKNPVEQVINPCFR